MFSLGAILASPIALHSALASCLVMAVHLFGAVRVFQNERWPSFTSVFFIGKHQLRSPRPSSVQTLSSTLPQLPRNTCPANLYRAYMYWPDDQRTAATPQALVPSSTQDQVRGGCTRQEWSSADAARATAETNLHTLQSCQRSRAAH